MKNLPTSSPLIKKPFGGLTSNMLRILAMVLMICDHLWAKVVPGNDWLTYIGRTTFPIFTFMISEGFFTQKPSGNTYSVCVAVATHFDGSDKRYSL